MAMWMGGRNNIRRGFLGGLKVWKVSTLAARLLLCQTKSAKPQQYGRFLYTTLRTKYSKPTPRKGAQLGQSTKIGPFSL